MFIRRDAVRASLALRYHRPEWDLKKNQEVYGDRHSVAGLGANLTIWLHVRAEPTAARPLVIPEDSLRPHLEEVKGILDHRCLFEDEDWFWTHVPTLENITLYVAEQIRRLPPPAGQWQAVTIEEGDQWRATKLFLTERLELWHTFQFDIWRLSAAVSGIPDSQSGLLMRRQDIEAAVKSTRFSRPPAFFHELRESLPGLIRLRVEDPTHLARDFRDTSG